MVDFSPDFAPIGRLGEVYRQAQQRAVREQALSQLGQGAGPLDYANTARTLLAAGDTEGGLSLARLAETATERQRQQANTDRAFEFQKQQAAEAARGFEIREYDKPDGTKGLVRIEKATGKPTPLDIGGGTDQPNNPFMSGGKMNESQSKDALYASRMLASERVLRTIDANVATNPVDKIRGGISDRIGFNVRSPEYQKFDQARRDFVNATLRRESGAVISDAEFANANQQYFPQPGDTAQVIQQKRLNRMEAIKGIGAGAGSGYRPEFKFDEKGEIIENPKPKTQALPRVTSPAEAAKLPKGTRFLDPNGVERIVP